MQLFRHSDEGDHTTTDGPQKPSRPANSAWRSLLAESSVVRTMDKDACACSQAQIDFIGTPPAPPRELLYGVRDNWGCGFADGLSDSSVVKSARRTHGIRRVLRLRSQSAGNEDGNSQPVAPCHQTRLSSTTKFTRRKVNVAERSERATLFPLGCIVSFCAFAKRFGNDATFRRFLLFANTLSVRVDVPATFI